MLAGAVPTAQCDPEADAWCREGVVIFSRASGPVIVPFQQVSDGSILDASWAHLYSAMTSDIRCTTASPDKQTGLRAALPPSWPTGIRCDQAMPGGAGNPAALRCAAQAAVVTGRVVLQ